MSSMVLHKYSHTRIFIVKLTRAARDWWISLAIDGTKTLSTVFIYFQITIPQISKSLESNCKFDLSISNKMWKHVFRFAVGSYIFTFFTGTYLVYTLFPLVCGNCPLTSNRGRCRNILSVDSRLNRINPITNTIFLPNAERGYRTKFEILLEGVFQYSIE